MFLAGAAAIMSTAAQIRRAWAHRAGSAAHARMTFAANAINIRKP